MSDKKVDESWKNQVEKEQQTAPLADNEPQGGRDLPEADFGLFVSSLGMQALMAMGEIENPTTNKKEKEPDQAKYLIDTLSMLKEKTKGNLREEEDRLLEQMLYELRIKYVTLDK